MKLKNLIPLCCRAKFVRQFGDARLLKNSDGRHELVGGSIADRQTALEWASLFAHEIVFTHFHRRKSRGNPVRIPRLQTV